MALSQSTNLNNQCPDVIWYNQSFHPSACHVCKMKLKHLDIIRQCVCRMIYYCCVDHELEDHIYHASFCSVIQSIFAQEDLRHFRAPTLNLVDWINSRNTLINLIELRLARPLYLHEKQMIMFVKSCLVCRTQENLSLCNQCSCVYYCPQHKIEGTEIHRSNCSDLLDCFNLDIKCTRSAFTVKFTKFFNKSKPLVNMDKFVEQYVFVISRIGKYLVISYTDYLSGPLTLCYWIQQFDLLKPESMAGPNFAVHIIDANFLDREYIEAWHLLLHYLPDVNNLRVELIGSLTSYQSSSILGCRFCSHRHKMLTYGCYRESYYQYVSSENYKKPNVIVGFESNLTTWNKESVITLKKNMRCPIIITGQSKVELNDYKFYIKSPEEYVAVNYTFYEAIANPFRSNRPYRKVESDGVFFRNKFVVVFKNHKD